MEGIVGGDQSADMCGSKFSRCPSWLTVGSWNGYRLPRSQVASAADGIEGVDPL